MIILSDDTKSLEIELASAVSDVPLQWTCSWIDVDDSCCGEIDASSCETKGEDQGTISSGTTTIAPAPGTPANPNETIVREIEFISVYNADSAPATLSLQINKSGTPTIILKITLAVGYTLIYNEDSGFVVYDSAGAYVTTVTSTTSAASLTATYVGYGSATNTLTGEADLTYIAGTNTLNSVNQSISGNVVFGGNVTYTPTVNNSLTGANQRIPSHVTANIVFTNAGLTSIGSANNGGVSGGHTLCITNATGASITIVNNYGSAAAGEAIITGLSGDQILPNNASLWLQYNSTSACWSSVGGGLIPVSSGISGLGTGIATFLATPSSANLAAAVTDETGSGLLVFATGPTMTGQILAAGTTTVSPLNFTAWANPITSPLAGQMNYDGLVPYFTHINAALGVLMAKQYSIVSASNFSLNTAAGVQSCFESTGDVWTLNGTTTYLVEGFYDITKSTNSVTVGIAFSLGGGASITLMKLFVNAYVGSVNVTQTSSNHTTVTQVSSTVVTASSALRTTIYFKGIMRMNAGGTVTPQIDFSGTAAGSPTMVAGSYITFTPIGTNTQNTVGNVS